MESDLNSSPVITGFGLVTALGRSANETWHALVQGRSINDHARVPGFSGPRRVTAMALEAASEAIAHAGWTENDLRQGDCGLFVGTSKGEIESWTEPANPQDNRESPLTPSPCTQGEGWGEGSSTFEARLPWTNSPLVHGLSGIEVELSRALKFGPGPRLTISSACSSGLHALLRAALAIQSGDARRVLVVAAEASVQPIFISSFKRLGVLAPEGHGCRPFDEDRSGFVISEAAAAICVESANSARRPIVRIDRFIAAGDATHLTAGDPEAKTLRHLLARMHGAGFDLIHAHATGTAVNDPSELSAIQTIAGKIRENSHPILYSHKGALGHSLGAAGLVSAVINCSCHQHGRVPGNIRSTRPLPTPGLQFSREPIQRRINRSLALAAGFGGPIAAISFVSI